MSAFKSDEEIEDLLNHSNNGVRKANVQVKIIGSGNHGNQSHESKKPGEQVRDKDSQATIAVTAELIGGNGASELLGIHPSAVSKYRNGKNANNDVDVVLRSKIDEKLGKINEKVVDRVDELMEIFSETKMGELKAAEIPSSAEKLINMFDKINRRNDKNNGNIQKPQVLVWAPQQININELPSKEV